MTEATTQRRTDAARVRRTISEMLQEISAIEYSLELFERKRDRIELARAADNVRALRKRLDRLEEMIAEAAA